MHLSHHHDGNGFRDRRIKRKGGNDKIKGMNNYIENHSR